MPGRIVSLSAARGRLARSAAFLKPMEAAVLNLRHGLLGRVVGYRTSAGGHARARIRTAKYSKCVPVNWELGERFNEAHYRDILSYAFLDPFLKEAGWELRQLIRNMYEPSWKGVSRDDWWHELPYSFVQREVGNSARWMCEQIFDAARLAYEDPDEAARLQGQDRRRRIGILRNSIRAALDFGITRQEVSELLDRAVVESVMDA